MHGYQRRHAIYRRFGLFERIERPDPRAIREILALGLPISGSVVSEGALFAVAALLMSTLGTEIVAAHQVAISYASLMFMIPLSLHSATTIHVGHQLGRGDLEAGRNAGWSGIAMCGAVMALSSLALLALNDGIAAAYTTDPDVRALAAWLLLFVAVFQIPDGLQVGAAGALRGYKDAQVPMAINFTAYWLIGFPLAWWFGIRQGAGPSGIWSGLIAGLVVCAVLLVWRFHRISRPRRAAAP
jgi:MATE family multidrug resistance protein